MAGEVENDLAIADRNIAIARHLLVNEPSGFRQPAFEWVVVVSYYAAVRGMNAGLFAMYDIQPRTHAQRTRQILESPELRESFDRYVDLENWSRDARYVAPPGNFDDSIARLALNHAHLIVSHVRQVISVR